MTEAIRLQLSRRKGFNLQELSLRTNGLPARGVTRPGPWGNPYVGDSCCADRARMVALYRKYLSRVENREVWALARAELAGHNLACFCPLDGPCHADTLLEVANGEPWVIIKRGVYYRPESSGYTADLEDAGWYTLSQALAERRVEPSAISIATVEARRAAA